MVFAPSRPRDECEVDAVGGVHVLFAFAKVLRDGVVIPAQRQWIGDILSRCTIATTDFQRGQIDAPAGSKVVGDQPQFGRTLVVCAPSQHPRRNLDNEALPVRGLHRRFVGGNRTEMQWSEREKAEACQSADGYQSDQRSPATAPQPGHVWICEHESTSATPKNCRDIPVTAQLTTVLRKLLHRPAACQRSSTATGAIEQQQPAGGQEFVSPCWSSTIEASLRPVPATAEDDDIAFSRDDRLSDA